MMEFQAGTNSLDGAENSAPESFGFGVVLRFAKVATAEFVKDQ